MGFLLRILGYAIAWIGYGYQYFTGEPLPEVNPDYFALFVLMLATFTKGPFSDWARDKFQQFRS